MSLEALVTSIEAGNDREVLDALSALPSLLRSTTSDGDTALHIACWQKRQALVERLLELGAAVDARGFVGRAPLHYAVHEGSAQSVPLVRALLRAGASPTMRDDQGFTPAEWADIEIYDEAARNEVRALLETDDASPSGLRDLLERTLDHAGEPRAQTAVALGRLRAAFCAGLDCDVDRAMAGLPSADARAVGDAVQLLGALSRSSWGEPLRAWLSEARAAKGRIEVAAIDRLSAALAREGGGPTTQERELEALRNRFGMGSVDPALVEVGPDFHATKARVDALERLGHTARAIDRLRQAFCAGTDLEAEEPSGVWNPDATCLGDAERLLEALRPTSLGEPIRAWLAEPRVSGSTMGWVHLYFACSPPSPTAR